MGFCSNFAVAYAKAQYDSRRAKRQLSRQVNSLDNSVAHMNFRLALRSPHCVRRTHRGPHYGKETFNNSKNTIMTKKIYHYRIGTRSSTLDERVYARK